MIKEKLYLIINCGGRAVCAFTTREEAQAFVGQYGSTNNYIFNLTVISVNVFEGCDDYETPKE